MFPGSDGIDERALRHFLHLEGQFSRHLAFLMHITSGYSARQTELVSMIWRNTRDHSRDVLLCPPGLDARWPEILLLCHHSKTKLKNGAVALHQRFAAPRVAECLLSYLVCIRPVTDRVRLHLRPSDEPLSHLFVDTTGLKSLEQAGFSSYLSAQTLDTCDVTSLPVTLKPSQWWHVIKSIGRGREL